MRIAVCILYREGHARRKHDLCRTYCLRLWTQVSARLRSEGVPAAMGDGTFAAATAP